MKTAVLMIDLQNAYFEDPALASRQETVVEAANLLVRTATAAQVPGAGEGRPASIDDLGGDLLRLNQERPPETLGLVELGNGGLPVGALARDVGAFLGLSLLRLGA